MSFHFLKYISLVINIFSIKLEDKLSIAIFGEGRGLNNNGLTNHRQVGVVTPKWWGVVAGHFLLRTGILN